MPGVNSAPNRNVYQEYFLVGKGVWCIGMTALLPLCTSCLEIWVPQPPGTLRACPRIALPLDICEMCTKSEISDIFVFFKKLFDLREYSHHSQISAACFTEGCTWDVLFIASSTVHFAKCLNIISHKKVPSMFLWHTKHIASDLYSGDNQFSSDVGYQQSWAFHCFP